VSHDENRAEYLIARYLKAAKEARSLAAQIESSTSRAVMLEVAETWERLAHLEETDLERKLSYPSN
jgi:hypothetical protein